MYYITMMNQLINTPELAVKVNKTRQHLWYILTGKKQALPLLALKIQDATNGLIKAVDISPALKEILKLIKKLKI